VCINNKKPQNEIFLLYIKLETIH